MLWKTPSFSLTALIGASALLATSGCGQATPRDSTATHSHPLPTASASPAQIQAWENDLDALYLDITGTAAQRNAGELVSYAKFKLPKADCITGMGVDYAPPPPLLEWTDWPEHNAGSWSTRWLAPLNDTTHLPALLQSEAEAQRAQESREGNELAHYDALSDADRSKWDKAMNACPDGQNYEEAWHPDHYYPLLTAYRVMLGKIDNSLTDNYGSEYVACMGKAGYRVVNHIDLESVAKERFSQNPSQVPPIGAAGNANWQSALNYQDAAMATDGVCRRAAHDAGWSTLGPKIAQFRADHATELAQEAAGWQALVKEAKAGPWQGLLP